MGRQTLLVTQGIELRQKRTSPPKVLSDGDRSNNSLCPRRGRPTRHHAALTHDQVQHTEAPAHHRGLGPQRQYFTFNSRQDTRKDPSAPLNKLVTHPTSLTRGRHQTSRHEVPQICSRFFSGHTKALPILAVIPRTPPLLRASSSLSSTMAQQEHPLLRWHHPIDPLIYLIDAHFYVIEAHFYLIEPLIDSIEIHT